MKTLKSNIAITLISLIITVILLLILSGITIGLLLNNGLISKTQIATNTYAESAHNETKSLTELYSSILISSDDANITISMKDLDALINEKVKKAIESSPSVPTGNIISQMGKVAPTGYLICDGQEYEISDYPILANYFKEQFGSEQYFGGEGSKFKVPDLRGEFLRGTGANSYASQCNGSEVGTHQEPTQHLNISANTNGNFHRATGTIELSYVDNYLGAINPTWNYYSQNGTYSSGTANYSRPYYASRPTNTSVLYCIKY